MKTSNPVDWNSAHQWMRMEGRKLDDLQVYVGIHQFINPKPNQKHRNEDSQNHNTFHFFLDLKNESHVRYEKNKLGHKQ